MENLVRREVIDTAQTLIIKVGTNVLSRDDDSLDEDRIACLAEQIHHVRQTGRQVIVVSSGAVGAGMGLLGLASRPTDLPHLQAAAAAGQARLIRLYDDALRPFGYHAAQMLVTANDFKSRTRYLNVRNTVSTLFEYNTIPIVNENDTVSTEEIKFGDNDQLAAMVTNLLQSPLLIILSVVDGLYDGDPCDPNSKQIPLVAEWSNDVCEYATMDTSRRGTGGMRSKLKAVRLATTVGENVIIANGTDPQVIDHILAGREVGTLFLATGMAIPAWKRWIGFTVPPKGRFFVDEGACKAVQKSGRSLLAVGITAVEGEFNRGEVVALVDPQGEEFARGLTNFNSHDARAIAGHSTGQIEQLLGSLPYEEVVHRNNLVVLH